MQRADNYSAARLGYNPADPANILLSSDPPLDAMHRAPTAPSRAGRLYSTPLIVVKSGSKKTSELNERKVGSHSFHPGEAVLGLIVPETRFM